MVEMSERAYDIVLFDLGGVLIELGGFAQWERWTQQTDTDAILQRWLRSPAVRAFEAGRSEPTAFAHAVVQEFRLPVTPEVFIQEFRTWPRRLLPGAWQLVAETACNTRVACLSNCNALHWPQITEMGVAELFEESAFSSHELGCLKPDLEVFELVARELEAAPERILLLDDNPVNVGGARAAGFSAERARGPVEARMRLQALNIL